MDLTPDKYHQALAYLTINSSFLGDLGLFHGRMGIVLFFAHYARVTQNKQYEDFAEILLDEIYEEIHWDLPINLENGLCGIGWGIEYLVQNGFMKGNTDEILADIDRKVLEIDPLRISDLSFRRGLAGIIFYVIARLNSYRETDKLPFDNAYLESLQKVLHRVNFIDNEIPINLKNSLIHVLNKGKINLSIPENLISSSLSLEKPFNNILLGIEDGLTGWLWSNLHSKKDSQNLSFKKDKCIFIFDEESRSTKYGIGTYVNQLTDALQGTEWQIIRIRVFAENKKTLIILQDEKAFYINIDRFKYRNYEVNDSFKRYYRNLFFVLYPYFKSRDIPPVFHLNAMQSEALADQLKYYFPKSQIILTVHYTNWSLDLLGDREKLKEIIASPKDEKNLAIIKGFETEKRLMLLSDQIIAIAQHSYDDIINLYQISKEKVTLITHGLMDAYQPLTEREKNDRRKKYGFSTDDQLLIFAGRIDPVKGVEYLVEAFILLIKRYSKLRLIIAGDGNFNTIFTLLQPVWSKVTCTGFIDKPTLYELVSISDIGILPSLHEEFGFVALEMMMMKLPLIVSNTTGLSELISQKENGLVVSLENKKENNNPNEICEAIQSLLDNKPLRLCYAEAAREKFLSCYTVDLFQKQMLDFYNSRSK